MKIYHFVLLFLVFFLAAIIKTDISIGKLKSIEKEKAEMEASLDSSTSDAVNYLASSGAHGTNSINKDEVVRTFLTSLYSSRGIISDPGARTEMELYIPVILLCDSDGYYIYYYDEYKANDGCTYSERTWTEKMPYSYKDKYFIYRFTLTDKVCVYDVNGMLSVTDGMIETDYHEFQTNAVYKSFREQHGDCILLDNEAFELTRKGAIINRLEETLAYYTSRHNSIAQRNGITYTFSFPSGQENEWAGYMDGVNLVVVFQGYPYGADRNYTFNKIAAARAFTLKKSAYYIEKKSWYYLAHKEGCPMLASNENILGEPVDSIEECIKMGAYCDDCIERGARVPDLK